MKTGFRFLALSMAAVCGAADAQSVVENAGISAAQRDYLEQRTCGAWHGRRIAAFRTEDGELPHLLRVSFECDAHDRFQDRPLATTGTCVGRDLDWACDKTGPQLDFGTAGNPRPVRLVDVTPEKGVELYAFIEALTRKGKRISSGILEGHLTLLTADDGATYLATFEFSDHANALVISSRCGKRGCRYKLDTAESYATYRDL
jgi:hypothetical protein